MLEVLKGVGGWQWWRVMLAVLKGVGGWQCMVEGHVSSTGGC